MRKYSVNIRSFEITLNKDDIRLLNGDENTTLC